MKINAIILAFAVSAMFMSCGHNSGSNVSREYTYNFGACICDNSQPNVERVGNIQHGSSNELNFNQANQLHITLPVYGFKSYSGSRSRRNNPMPFSYDDYVHVTKVLPESSYCQVDTFTLLSFTVDGIAKMAGEFINAGMVDVTDNPNNTTTYGYSGNQITMNYSGFNVGGLPESISFTADLRDFNLINRPYRYYTPRCAHARYRNYIEFVATGTHTLNGVTTTYNAGSGLVLKLEISPDLRDPSEYDDEMTYKTVLEVADFKRRVFKEMNGFFVHNQSNTFNAGHFTIKESVWID